MQLSSPGVQNHNHSERVVIFFLLIYVVKDHSTLNDVKRIRVKYTYYYGRDV